MNFFRGEWAIILEKQLGYLNTEHSGALEIHSGQADWPHTLGKRGNCKTQEEGA
jgi:hypothetical protein